MHSMMRETIDLARPKQIAVVGATGPTGRHLVEQVRERGRAVVAVSRSPENLKRCFAGRNVRTAVSDAGDRGALGEVLAGSDVVVDCVGLPPERMQDHAPVARAIAEAADDVGARVVQISSFWSFLPLEREPLDETHPRVGGSEYSVARRQAEDVMLEAGAAVVHLPDFFGPWVHTSTLQRSLEEAVEGKPVSCIGSRETRREYIFVPDAMRLVAELLDHDEAYGRSWVFPASGPLSMKDAVDIAGRHLGRDLKVRSAPGWMLKALSLFSSDLKAFRPMIDDYCQPITYSGQRLRGLLGSVEMTPYEEAIGVTLDWMRERESVSERAAS